MGIEKKITIPKAKSNNSKCNDTHKWETTDEVIVLITKNGGDLIVDELPGRGAVKQRIADQEQKLQNYKSKSTSSHHSSVENYGTHQTNGKKISKIPRRSTSVSSNNNSLKSVSDSISQSTTSTRIPIFKDSALFKRRAFKDNTKHLYQIDKAESWVLISPELLDLVEVKKLIVNIASNKADALTYRNTEKVRLMNLNQKEISILEEELPKLCKELKSKERINIFRN